MRENDWLASLVERIPAGPVLCLGEGEGRNATYLAGLGYEVSAVDASSVGMAKTRKLAESRGVFVETHVADLADFDLGEERWGSIISIFCHLPPELRADVHRRCVTGLVSGGAFVLEGFTPRQLEYGTGGPPRVEVMMELSELRFELEGLSFEIARELDRDVVEGRYHTGKAAVIQLLGFKSPSSPRRAAESGGGPS